MADGYRVRGERTGSGTWKLSDFYNGLRIENLETGFGEEAFVRLEAQALAWGLERPNSVAAKLVYATLIRDRKWFLRGGGYAQDLTDAQRRAFHEYHLKERAYLTSIHEEASVDPRWFELLMQLARDEVWTDTDLEPWSKQASSLQPYFYEAWFRIIDRNVPQWGGSYVKTRELIERVVEATRDEDGETFFARGYWYVYQIYGREAASEIGLEWHEINSGFHDLIKSYPSQWNLNAHAKFACLAEDRSTLLAILARIEGSWAHQIWDNGEQPIVCTVWAQQPERNIQVR